jgi:3-deoxy-D-manno-octulosonic-acid transferase
MRALARAAYALLLWLALPYALWHLWWRGRRQPGYRRQVGERFGRYAEKVDAPVIWLHAVSVGETRAAQPLVEALLERHPGHRLLVTHGTPTGRETGEALFGARVSRAYLPYDYPYAVRRFLEHWRPVAGVLIETELWFNLVRAARAAGVPLCLANARLSERSARRYRRCAPLAREALGALAGVYAQSEADAARLTALGAPAVEVLGNVKFDLEPPAPLVRLGARWRERLSAGGRLLWVAASTREGEEPLLLDAWQAVREAAQRRGEEPPLLAIVPRHPQRFDEVAALIEARGLALARRSAALDRPNVPDVPAVPDAPDAPPGPAPAVDVLLGDSMGELYAWYAAADFAFVGGTLLAHGGQNLIEACAVGCPVLIGAHTDNFADATELALAAGAAERVADAAGLAAAVSALAGDAPRRARMGAAGRTFAAAHRGATARIVERLDALIARRATGRAT